MSRPIEERRPGGLGIHLVKKMVDRIEHEYCGPTNRTTFVKAHRLARVLYRRGSYQ